MDVPKANDTAGIDRLLELVDRLEKRDYCYGRERSQFILRDYMEVFFFLFTLTVNTLNIHYSNSLESSSEKSHSKL